MPHDATPLPPTDESRTIASEAATEILRMLTSDCLDRLGDSTADDDCRSTPRTLRQETTMWF